MTWGTAGTAGTVPTAISASKVVIGGKIYIVATISPVTMAANAGTETLITCELPAELAANTTGTTPAAAGTALALSIGETQLTGSVAVGLVDPNTVSVLLSGALTADKGVYMGSVTLFYPAGG